MNNDAEAQTLVSGTRGREFESHRPDHFSQGAVNLSRVGGTDGMKRHEADDRLAPPLIKPDGRFSHLRLAEGHSLALLPRSCLCPRRPFGQPIQAVAFPQFLPQLRLAFRVGFQVRIFPSALAAPPAHAIPEEPPTRVAASFTGAHPNSELGRARRRFSRSVRARLSPAAVGRTTQTAGKVRESLARPSGCR